VIDAFSTKFQAKTSTKWPDRARFVKKPPPGKYELLEMDHEADEEEEEEAALAERLASDNAGQPAAAAAARSPLAGADEVSSE
jgi:hypothetical protein